MKRLASIIALLVLSLSAYAQMIRSDVVKDGSRIIDCKPCTVVQEDCGYLMSYRYVKSADSEGYMLELICSGQRAWKVDTNDSCIVKFTDGTFTTIRALMPSVDYQGANIVTYYIPVNTISDHLKGLTDIMLRTSYMGEAFPVKIRMTHEAASHMTEACLQLMAATGR